MEPLRTGQRVPEWLQKEAEDAVLTQETPMLGMELYSLDYLEESNTHSAAITMKEVRFLNHSMHTLMSRFLRYFDPLMSTPPKPLRYADQLDEPHGGDTSVALTALLRRTEGEYRRSACSYLPLHRPPRPAEGRRAVPHV
ncbi:hypothetical protein STCU_10067 [Strigomonas culicis]|uniref:Uncharacterized protein n=1 Tax=Strigomonas culicis TaxID=28005 RepID=S9TJL3_9TRYP|nr:hypothetical protein STCU_10067 [Strigomonas culicis]|eukprot:EPY18302.1 hypothetical protein STCU_10067 [Strigomonas culicis]